MLDLLEQVDSKHVQEDVRQLRGLVDYAAANEFQPWSAGELTEQHLPRQLMQLMDVCREVREIVVRKQIASTDGVGHPSGGIFLYWYPFKLAGSYWAAASVDIKAWAEYGQGPLWLVLSDKAQTAARTAFSDALRAHQYGFALPLAIPPGSSRNELISSLVEQVRSAAARLVAATPASSVAADGDLPQKNPNAARDGVGDRLTDTTGAGPGRSGHGISVPIEPDGSGTA